MQGGDRPSEPHLEEKGSGTEWWELGKCWVVEATGRRKLSFNQLGGHGESWVGLIMTSLTVVLGIPVNAADWMRAAPWFLEVTRQGTQDRKLRMGNTHIYLLIPQYLYPYTYWLFYYFRLLPFNLSITLIS